MKETHTRLPKLPSPDRCCGCGACRAICPKGAIAMVADAEGFLQPTVNAAQCAHCGKCESVCPVLHPGKPRQPLEVYAAKAQDDELRRGSASGGIFTVLAQETLKRGGVVFGAGFERPTWRVIHKAATTEEELDDLRGSKYVQSDTGDTFKEAKAYLEAGREVLYSGCPCQIAALKRFLGRDYPNLLTVDIVCHGAPSPALWRRYLSCRERELGVIDQVHSRRFCAWRDFVISIKAKGKTGYAYSADQNTDPYMRLFLTFGFLRKACHSCAFRNFRSSADITIGDYYNIRRIHPELDNEVGLSMVLIHNPKCLLQKNAELFRVLECWPVQDPNLHRSNPPIFESSKVSRNYDFLYGNLDAWNFDELVERTLSKRSTGLVYHLIWWLKRLVVNREVNRISWT